MTDYQNELVMEHLDLVNWVIRTRISVPNRPLSLNGLEYLKNDADEVIYFAGVEAAKVYLREHGVTEDEMEDMVFRKSVGTCFRCGDPLFLSDIPEYTCQCFRCDEDFYSIEQDVDL